MTTTARPLELWDVDKLIPYEKNAKKHSPEQIDKLVRSIEEFGWSQPIVVDKNGVIIIGHGRRMAALKMNQKKVPVDVRRDLTPAQCDALRLADNRVTSTEYDMNLIQEELRRLSEEDFDIGSLGFDQREIDFALGDLGEMNDDFFVEDVAEAVEAQRSDNERAAEEMDDVAAPVADALGFKRVTIAQSRDIRNLMSRIESRYTDKAGAEALIDFLSRALGDQ